MPATVHRWVADGIAQPKLSDCFASWRSLAPDTPLELSEMTDWGTPTLFLNDNYRPSDDDLSAFARRGTRVEAAVIVRIEAVADVVLADGRKLSMNGLFTQPRTHMASNIATRLGCTLTQGPMGAFIQGGRHAANVGVECFRLRRRSACSW